MKKLVLNIFLVLCMIAPALADTVQESVLNVYAKYEKEYTPDAAKVNFSLTDSGLNIKEIKQKNDKTIDNVIQLIKKELGQNDSVKTTNYSIRSVYNYKDKVKVFQKYEITNGFEVKLKDISKVSQIIKIATDNGIKNVGNIQFYIEDKDKVSNEAISEAVKMAKSRANIIASASGAQISRIKSINVTSSLDNEYSSRRYLSLAKANTLDASMSTANEDYTEPIEAGMIKVSATANIDFYLK